MGRATIKYKRQPEFCFGCGKLGHVDRQLNSEITVSEEEDGDLMYGLWIRADRPRRRKEQCRYVGTKQGGATGENKRRHWKDMIKDKEERGEKAVPQGREAGEYTYKNAAGEGNDVAGGREAGATRATV